MHVVNRMESRCVMKLKELLKIAPCCINLYVEDGSDYKDLWCGNHCKVPGEYLDRIVRVVGPSGKILDIELKK